MRQDIEILPDNRLFPTVMNINQGQNKIETALYSMKDYVVNEVDLSTCDWYAVLIGVYGMDEIELTHEVDEGVLKVRWDLNDYVTNIGQTLTYQIVAKNSDAAVYYSNKGIILNSQSIHADEFIASNYPSIMKQWLDKMANLKAEATAIQEELEEYAIKFTNSIFYIDWDKTIPVEDRIDGRLYYQWTNADKTKGRFEDPEGVPLIPEAKAGCSLPMFSFIWSDHLCNDASFLRADTFSWHDSAIYVSAYKTIFDEYHNEGSIEQTDERGITYKLSTNGFKIADASQEEAILNLYLENGSAWYYILDVENARFKLPRENFEDKKLYFFVGVYEREETELNIGILTEMANGTDLEVIVNEIDEVKEQAISELNTATDNEIARLQDGGVDDLQSQIDGLTAQVSALQAEIQTMLGRMDFANAVSFQVTKSEPYTISKDGYIQLYYVDSYSNTTYMTINGSNYCSTESINNGLVSSVIPVSEGDVIGMTGGTIKAVFIPQKGV